MNKKSIYTETLSIWDAALSNSTISALPKSLVESLSSLPLSESNRNVIIIFNLKTFKPEYVSENCKEVLGFSHEEPMQHGSLFFFTHLISEHQKIPMILTQWVVSNMAQIPFEEKINMRTVYCGMSFNHTEKKVIRLIIQHHYYEVNEDRTPLRTFVTMTDISHLLKNDKVWFRFQYGSDPIQTKTYDFQTATATNNDMVSEREMAVLKLIALGHDAGEIGKELFISPNTVNNHRQNMLNRLGVKDATALVQICRICGII
jgi:DNA-binding CsgD family transcriptional regulator